MKVILYDLKGKKKNDVELPEIFNDDVREDVVIKYFEADKFKHPSSPYVEAGRRHSASGTISHKRHDWKGHYGKGISRVPRKTMRRSGTQFIWVGAEVSGTRGGRRAHPPKGIGKEKKINKKEIEMAMNSGFVATGNSEWILKRYESLNNLNIKTPVVVESKLDNIKTKDFIAMLKEIFGDVFPLIMKKKSVRSGKGKARGRKYKSNAGLLFVKSKNEKIKVNGIDMKDINEITMNDLYPLGRLCVYTEKALEEIKGVAKK